MLKLVRVLLLTLLISFLLLQKDHELLQAAAWNNEPLLAFDHARQLLTGVPLGSMNLARIPSIFPDYLIAIALAITGLSFQWQYAIFVLIFAALQLYLSAGIICFLWQIRIEFGLIIAGLVSFGLAAASSDYSLNLQLSHLPLNHGGNVIMIMGFIWLMLATFKQSISTKAILTFPFLGLLAIAGLASLSNRLFVLQAVLPAIICYALDHQYRRCFLLGLASCLGCVASLFLLKVGCFPPVANNLNLVVERLLGFGQVSLWPNFNVGLGFIFLFEIVFSGCILSKPNKFNMSSNLMARFLATSVVIIILPYLQYCLNQPGGIERYLYAPLFLAPVFIAQPIIAICRALRYVIKFQFIATAMLTLLALSFIQSIGHQKLWLHEFLGWDNPGVYSIVKALPRGAAVLTPDGLEGRWHSRTLKASADWQLWFSSITGNGRANPWDQGKWEFRELFPKRKLRSYMAVLVPKAFRNSAIQWYGQPTRKVYLDHKGGSSLWIYDPPTNQRLLASIWADFQLPFRPECVSWR